jgi:hypothetical protein
MGTDMKRLALLSATPLALPASCWIAGCECSWLCPGYGASACIAAAALGAAALFAGLSLLHAFAALASLGD